MKNIYFASDFHLGAPSYEKSRLRENSIVAWLDFIKSDASEIFLMGDIFDFWFEYKTVIPKGFIRLQGKFAELCDAGIKIYFFKGNHDMWVFDYFKKEFNLIVVDDELQIQRNGKKFYLHHGDGLGEGDNGYKLLKKIFRSKFCQWMFERIHPNFGVGIANYWSNQSKIANIDKIRNDETEITWAKSIISQLKENNNINFLIVGHRHHPINKDINAIQYINLGEWVTHKTYAVFDGTTLQLKKWNV